MVTVGSKGTLPTYIPDGTKIVNHIQNICGNCGRADVILCKPITKAVIDTEKCGKVMSYYEKIVKAYCAVCNMITCPATESIPGTSLEPNLRCIVMNIHKVAPAVRGISRLLVSNHHTFLADGTVSNCLSAIAEYVRNGGLLEKVNPPSTNPKLPEPLELPHLPSGKQDGKQELPEPLELPHLPSCQLHQRINVDFQVT